MLQAWLKSNREEWPASKARTGFLLPALGRAPAAATAAPATSGAATGVS